jgi:LmbE family N-acetylglucosaminyl deacetylase
VLFRLGVMAGLIAATMVAAMPVSAMPASCSGSNLYIAAHADDPLLFMLPDIGADISAGRCVRVVVLTAGDAGLGQAYWLAREAGLAAAVALLAGTSDVWRMRDAGIPDHPAPLFTLTGDPRVSLVFMRLPDGRSDGSGFDGHGSLLELWQGAISALSSLPLDEPTPTYWPSMYSRPDLIGALLWLMNTSTADKIGVQDYLGMVSGAGDHADHRAGARFAVAAALSYDHPAVLSGYQDYQIRGEPVNLDAAQQGQKQAAWLTYVAYDSMPGLCRTAPTCEQGQNFGQYWQREYTFPPILLPTRRSPIQLTTQPPPDPQQTAP